MYTSKASMERWSELAKATKNMLLNGNQSPMSKATMSNPEQGEKKSQEKPQEKLSSKIELTLALPINQVTSGQTEEFTPTDLQQAVIWSEVLGKPVSKRKERRYYGN